MTIIADMVRQSTRTTGRKTVGIEIELEGLTHALGDREHAEAVGGQIIAPHATAHVDGSLRNGGIEFVTRKLRNDSEVSQALDCIYAAARKLKLKESNRAGIHVHLNVQDLTFTKYWNLLCWYIMLEPAIFDYLGDGRDRSIYCRPLYKHVSLEQLQKMRLNLKAELWIEQPHKYFALNTASTRSYGTLEWRHMKSTLDQGAVHNWVNMIKAFKDLADVPYKNFNTLKSVRGAFARELPTMNTQKFARAFEQETLPMVLSIQDAAAKLAWNKGKTKLGATNDSYAKFMASREAPVKKSQQVLVDDPFVDAQMADNRWRQAMDQFMEEVQQRNEAHRQAVQQQNLVRRPIRDLIVQHEELVPVDPNELVEDDVPVNDVGEF